MLLPLSNDLSNDQLAYINHNPVSTDVLRTMSTQVSGTTGAGGSSGGIASTLTCVVLTGPIQAESVVVAENDVTTTEAVAMTNSLGNASTTISNGSTSAQGV